MKYGGTKARSQLDFGAMPEAMSGLARIQPRRIIFAPNHEIYALPFFSMQKFSRGYCSSGEINLL